MSVNIGCKSALVVAFATFGVMGRGLSQEAAAPPGSAQPGAAHSQHAGTAQKKDAHPPTDTQRRRASKLYLSAAKLYEQGNLEEALRDDQQAAALDPGNR